MKRTTIKSGAGVAGLSHAVRGWMLGAGVSLMVLPHGLLAQAGVAPEKATAATVQAGFATPPDDARIMMRWWWFGPAVVKPEIEREMLAMKAGGIGGFEIQPVYAVALDDKSKDFKNLPYLSDGFMDVLKFTGEKAHENGMRVDLTLASGWPYGGPHVSIDEAASRLRFAAAELPAGATSLAVPNIGNGEKLIAIFAGEGTTKTYDAASMMQLAVQPVAGRIAVAPGQRGRVVLFFIASRTGQMVKRAAVDADGFVLDHFSTKAVQSHLNLVANKLIAAFGDNPPYAVFSDSLEVYGADWTDDLLPEFQKRRGYDLTPHLPELWSGTGPGAAAVRHDWGVTLTELVNERYLTPVNEWAKAHHTKFRSQTYGEPAVSLSSASLATLPEGEGPQWRAFSFTRLATSVSHLYDRNVTSAETWTWLHSPAFRATPLDMKVEADRFFLQGVNQLIGHGWPYTAPGVEEPGWAFYAAAVFNDHNPWWPVMPEVTKYLQRMSYLMRQGKPANDIAILLPNDDVYAEFKPGHVALSAEMQRYIKPELIEQVLNNGYNLDYIDAEAIEKVGIPYPVLVLPHVDRLSPGTLKAIAAYTAKGGKVIAVGSLPAHAPGFEHEAEISKEVAGLSQTIFSDSKVARQVTGEGDLGAALKQMLPADMSLTGTSTEMGFVHRKLADSDVYFVVNSSNQPSHASATFRASRKYVTSLDPFTGESTAMPAGAVSLELAPYESRVYVLTDAPMAGALKAGAMKSWAQFADLSKDWTVSFPALKISKTEAKPASWTDDPATKYFSGEAIYRKMVHVSASDLKGAEMALDFGAGTPVTVDPAIKAGMRALLESPVREAAVVYVNGKRAGGVWHPPYRVEIGALLHEGDNAIEVRVDNLAINTLAGRTPTDYRLLSARYGQRFIPQDMDHLEPLPSGILGPVQLMKK